uniref:Uncharacterized protein n=1 Tax=Amphimedon queenslandica TaxID=400682 RepID=A0A1X7T0P6_AMPQE
MSEPGSSYDRKMVEEHKEVLVVVVEVMGLLVEVPGVGDLGEKEESGAGQRIITAEEGKNGGRPRSCSRVIFMELDLGTKGEVRERKRRERNGVAAATTQ